MEEMKECQSFSGAAVSVLGLEHLIDRSDSERLSKLGHGHGCLSSYLNECDCSSKATLKASTLENHRKTIRPKTSQFKLGIHFFLRRSLAKHLVSSMLRTAYVRVSCQTPAGDQHKHGRCWSKPLAA